MRILLDTNVLVSAILYGEQPRQILRFVLSGKAVGITSEVLVNELVEVLRFKFGVGQGTLVLLEKLMTENFVVVEPVETVRILHDEADNRVLEAALAGKCDFIITGDKELLCLDECDVVKIISASEVFH